MTKIIFERNIANEGLILDSAKLNGYEETETKEITKEMLVSEAQVEGYSIKEVLEGNTKCIAIIEKKEITNPETPAEYMAKLYQKLIDDKIKADTFVIQKKELEEKRKAEDEVIKTAVKEQIGETNVIIE